MAGDLLMLWACVCPLSISHPSRLPGSRLIGQSYSVPLRVSVSEMLPGFDPHLLRRGWWWTLPFLMPDLGATESILSAETLGSDWRLGPATGLFKVPEVFEMEG